MPSTAAATAATADLSEEDRAAIAAAMADLDAQERERMNRESGRPYAPHHPSTYWVMRWLSQHLDTSGDCRPVHHALLVFAVVRVHVLCCVWVCCTAGSVGSWL